MADVPTLEDTAAAVEALHQGFDKDIKDQASQYLEKVQSSIHAWGICDTILQQRLSLEMCYFAAQTMRTKVKLYFPELVPESIPSLRDSLFEHLKYFSACGIAAVVKQLALAIADLAVLMPDWQNPLSDIIGRLYSPEHMNALLDVLSLLPEEISNRDLRVTQDRRNAISASMGPESELVYPFILQILSESGENTDLQCRIFRCLASWLVFGGQGSLQFVESPLLGMMFEAFSDPALTDDAAKAIRSAIYLSEDRRHHEPLRVQLVPRVLALRAAMHEAAAAENQEGVELIVNIFADLAESMVDEYGPEWTKENVEFANLMLECSSYPATEVVLITFHFWYDLSDVAYRFVDRESGQKYCDQRPVLPLRPYFEELLAITTRLVQAPDDQPGLLAPQSDLAEFRYRTRNFLEECSWVLGTTNNLSLLFSHMSSLDGSWAPLEATLFIMTCIARNAPSVDETVVENILLKVVALPADAHVLLRQTAIKLTGELAHWIVKHEAAVSPVCEFLLNSMQIRDVVPACADTIKMLCTLGKRRLAPFFPTLLEIIQQGHAIGFTRDDVEIIRKAAAKVVADLPLEGELSMGSAMDRLCAPIFEPLRHHLTTDKNQNAVQEYLSQLATVMQSVNVPEKLAEQCEVHPLWPAAQVTWELVHQSLTEFQKNTDVVEASCRCLKYMIRCLYTRAAPMIAEIAMQMIGLFEAEHHSACLYVCSKIVEIFGALDEHVPMLQHFLQVLTPTTFAILTETPTSIQDHPDLVEDYFRFNPLVLLQSERLPGIMDCTKSCLLFNHRDAQENVTMFLKTLIGLPRVQHTTEMTEAVAEHTSRILHEHGQHFVDAFIQAVTGELPTHMIPDQTEAMFEIALFSRDVMLGFLSSCQGLVGLPAHVATPEEIQEFMRAFATQKMLRDLQKDVSTFSRLFPR